MLGPIKMVYISIIGLSIVCVILLFYKLVFPKKNFPYFFATVLFSIPPIISILRFGTYESGDLSLHAKFVMDFFQNLTEGNFIPQLAMHTCLSYECPNFLYMYPFPYYLISGIHFLGFTIISSIKYYLIITYVLSGIFMYMFVRTEINSKAGFIASIFYLYAPYHLVDLHFRITVAEMASFMLLPIIFYLINKVFYSYRYFWYLCLSLSFSLLILSHQAIIVTSFPLLVIYMYILYRRKRNLKKIMTSFFALISGFLITIYYWAPVLIEKRFINFGNTPSISFPNLQDFLFSPYRYGFLFQGPEGQLSFVIGYSQIFIFLISIYLYKKYKFGKQSHLYLLFLFTFILILIMMQSFTKNLWETIPLIKSFQFSYRLLLIIGFSISIIAGVISTRIKQSILVIIIFITIFTTILNWGNRRVISEINDEYLKNELYNGNPGHGDLTTPKWVDTKNISDYPLRDKRLSYLKGDGDIKQIYNSTIKHSYIIDSNQESLLKENTFYYPGWSVRIDGVMVPVEFSTKRSQGLIVFKVGSGIHLVEVLFTNTKTRQFFLHVSILSVIFLFIIPLLPVRKMTKKII